MKKKILSSYLFLALIIGLSQLSFNTDPAEKALATVTQYFHEGLLEMEQSIETYVILANELDRSETSIKQLQQTHLKTRSAFKRIEFLLEYYDRYSVKKHLNGAPLPSVEPNVPEVIEIKPEGLQVLDELVFAENVLEEKEEIINLTKKLQIKFNAIRKFQLTQRIEHRHVFEAIRQELIRVFTLGVTGFDTPGSVNALPESQQSFYGIQSAIQPYLSLIEKNNQEIVKEIVHLLNNTITYLEENNDFDQFNRLTFLKNYIDPLYKNFHQAHLILQIETIKEITNHPQPVNYHATGIFDENFLNPSYFASIDLAAPQAQKRKELGRLLFFDPILSSNNERACASCHQPNKAFTDGMPKSLAMNGTAHIQRNAPTVINSVYSERYFYDLREPNLERQIKHVILDSLEFNTDFFAIVEKLDQSETYKKMFEEAYEEFPQYYLSKWSVSDALANYVASLTSFNSPFDQYVRGEREELTEATKRGFNLFMGKAACGTCHFAPTFNGTVPPMFEESESEILGVPIANDTLNLYLDPDFGRIQSSRPIDQAPFYAHSFKTVTVRNISQTAPYMHNGVYKTLEEVIDFYNRGGGAGMGMDVPYQTLPDVPLNLSKSEISDLVAFMESLTDETEFEIPNTLPSFENQPEWNKRKIGGNY